MQYFAGGFLAGNLLLRLAPKPVTSVYVVSLVPKDDSSETETLGVFSEIEGACEYAESISRNYNRYEWFIRIEQIQINAPKEPKLKDEPNPDMYPCAVEWEDF